MSYSTIQLLQAAYKRALNPVVGIAFVTLITGTLNLLVSGDVKFLYNRWFTDPKLEMKEISSSVVQFVRNDSTEIKQLLSYKLSATEKISEIKISALFGAETRIQKHGISYNAPLKGYSARLDGHHYIHIALDHGLHQDRYAMIFLETSRMVAGSADAKLELPEFEYEGIDHYERKFYLVLPSRTSNENSSILGGT